MTKNNKLETPNDFAMRVAPGSDISSQIGATTTTTITTTTATTTTTYFAVQCATPSALQSITPQSVLPCFQTKQV